MKLAAGGVHSLLDASQAKAPALVQVGRGRFIALSVVQYGNMDLAAVPGNGNCCSRRTGMLQRIE